MPVCLSSQHPESVRRLGLVSYSAIAAFAWALAIGAAQEARAQESEPVELPPINVEGEASDGYKVDRSASPKFTQPLVDTPRTVTIVTDEMMEDMGATSLRDVLRTQPGITLDSGEGGLSHSDRMFIRGFDASNDMFVDGARDRGPQFRDPFNMEQVEIVKGPGGAYAGRGSTGGTLNLVSKTPKAADFGRVQGTLGNADNKRGTIDVNRKLDDNQAFRFNFMYHDGEVPGRDEVSFEKWGFSPSYTIGLNGPTQLTLSYYHLSQDDIPDYGHPYDPATGEPVAVNRENFYGVLARDFQEIETDIASATVDHRFSDTMSLRNLLRVNRTNNNYIVTKPEYDTITSVDRADRSRDDENLAISNQTDLTLRFKTANLTHDLVTGMELAYERNESNSRSVDDAAAADLQNPDPFVGYTGNISYTGSNTETTAKTAAFYAFDTVELNPQFEVSGGLRWDHFDAENSTVSRTDKLTSYQVGAVYKPAPNGSIYVSHSISYNPSAESVSLSTSNANTDPEETKAYELGTKWDFLDDSLSVSAAVFRTHKTNARVSSGGRGSPQVLEGEQRVDGIELGVTGQPTPDWNVFAGYTFLKSDIVKDNNSGDEGNEFGEVAPHIFSVWSTYQINREWKVGGGAYYSAARKTSDSNSSELPSYWRFDAMASWQITQQVDVRLNINNLFDKTYYDSTHSTQFAYVAPGRSILLSTGFDF